MTQAPSLLYASSVFGEGVVTKFVMQALHAVPCDIPIPHIDATSQGSYHVSNRLGSKRRIDLIGQK